MKIYLTIAECLGTDNEFTTEVYPSTSAQEAGEMASSLIADMIETMGVEEDIDPTAIWEIEGDGWFYRVRTETHEINGMKSNDKRYATNIEWDTDECFIEDEIISASEILPSRVEIPSDIDDDEIADYLSDEYGYCVFRFNIEK